ncbi:MAG: hypothetical protein GY803_01550 [Chloroflexi bacterium]|nr:hypothetical protein [Chloroflexota bacterium]
MFYEPAYTGSGIRIHAVIVPEDGEVGTAVAQTVLSLCEDGKNEDNSNPTLRIP